ncbi:uncharacterized protein [Solanum lycopersicum]|uniref:uncharacterized protein n=1 Tax=Solanum lycopersicum TaxID=4081 RepID=UPI0002BC8073|nr:uncharacterized protein LOC101262557 [Solanum lycopersicum]
MTFLGYVVLDNGVEVDPSKTKVVNNWPRHLTLTYIRRFLGLAGYYRRTCHLEFDVNDKLYLTISPMKGARKIGGKRKFSLRHDGPYEILQRAGEVDYELVLPTELASIHPFVHVSMLKKCFGDPASIMSVEGLRVDEDLSYEEVPFEILDRQVKRLRRKKVATMIKLWRNHLVEGDTLEAKAYMIFQNPNIFSS